MVFVLVKVRQGTAAHDIKNLCFYLEWLFSGVFAFVRFQVSQLAEALSASKAACIGFITRVLSLTLNDTISPSSIPH